MFGNRAETLALAYEKLQFVSLYRPHAQDVNSLYELDASLLKLGAKLHGHDVIVSGDSDPLNISWEGL